MARGTKVSETERAEWIADLRDVLDRASKDRDGHPIVWQIVQHVTRSGMTRYIGNFVIVDGDLWRIDYRVSRILGWPTSQVHGGVKVSGVGMDMGFHLVYTLSRALYAGRVTAESGGCDPGYLVKQRWL